MGVDVLGVDISGVDNLGVDILRVDILGGTRLIEFLWDKVATVWLCYQTPSRFLRERSGHETSFQKDDMAPGYSFVTSELLRA